MAFDSGMKLAAAPFVAVLAFAALALSPEKAAAHGNTIDLNVWCQAVHNKGGIKLPGDRKWKARYNSRKKRWDCVLPKGFGFNKILSEVVKPLNLVAACGKWGGSRKVHYHEGMNVKAASSVHCGKHDGTVKRGHDKPTKLRFCNRSSYAEVSAAYVYWDRRKGRGGWTSEGWWTIKRGDCKQTTVPGGPSGRPYSGDVYVFGENNATQWGGKDAHFCINSGKNFTLTTSDKIGCGGVYKKVGMTKLKVSPGENSWSFR